MGKVLYKFGDDISTDIIYPGRYMATVLPSETPQYAFADEEDLNERLNGGDFEKGDILLGGKNFGCGSSREQAASTIKGHNLIVVARNFARIFLQNSINLGLQTVICPGIEAEEDDHLEITEQMLINKTTDKEFEIIPHSKQQQDIINAGGLIPYTRTRFLKMKKAPN